MALAQVCMEVAKVLAAIELPADSAAKKKKPHEVFEIPPGSNVMLTSKVPCFIVWADAVPERLRMGNLVEVNQTLQIDFYGETGDNGLRFAREFFDAASRAVNDQQRAGTRFNESVDLVGDLRTERPQEAAMEWAKATYPGWRAFLDLQWFEDVG
ncbi:MAG: hypothetical protein AB7P33_09850 [Dehalococcoidia bacterium]